MQQFQIGHTVHTQPSPVRKVTAAEAANLISQKFGDAVLDSVIVRFHNPILLSVAEPNQASFIDCLPKQLIDTRSRARQSYAPTGSSSGSASWISKR